MKFPAALFFALLCTFSVLAQKKPPKGFQEAPSLSITGDFDGDGKHDTLSQFITDSIGNPVDYIIELDEQTEGYYPMMLSDKYGYRGAITLNGRPADIMEGSDLFVYCLINLGNINGTKGDEIALVPSNLDFSAMSHCSIYSYCKGRWVAVFSFKVTENAFDYDGAVAPVFTTIPGALEKRNCKWVYMNYYEWMEADNPKMKPLKVADCK